MVSLGLVLPWFWEEIMVLTIDNSKDMITKFLTRYGFQIFLHSLWRERNDRRHVPLQPVFQLLLVCWIGISETAAARYDCWVFFVTMKAYKFGFPLLKLKEVSKQGFFFSILLSQSCSTCCKNSVFFILSKFNIY